MNEPRIVLSNEKLVAEWQRHLRAAEKLKKREYLFQIALKAYLADFEAIESIANPLKRDNAFRQILSIEGRLLSFSEAERFSHAQRARG